MTKNEFVKQCEHCGLKWFTDETIIHTKECVWSPCNGEVVTARKRYAYCDEMAGLAGLVIIGELTYDEAEKICYDRYWNEDISCSMRMLDVIAELHGLVRKHARAVAPVYVQHMNNMVDKIIDLQRNSLKDKEHG
jgi:hypothetical protein